MPIRAFPSVHSATTKSEPSFGPHALKRLVDEQTTVARRDFGHYTFYKVYPAMMVLVVAGTVAVTVAARRIPIQIPRKVMGRGRIREGQKTFIPLRINSSGVMPIIFAQSLIIVPGTIATFSGNQTLRRLTQK